MDIEMQSMESVPSVNASCGGTEKPETTLEGVGIVKCDQETRRSHIILLISAGLSNLLCWPIGIIALWKILQIGNLKHDEEKARIKVALRDVKMLLYHAIGWGLLFYLVLAIVTIIQYSGD